MPLAVYDKSDFCRLRWRRTICRQFVCIHGFWFQLQHLSASSRFPCFAGVDGRRICIWESDDRMREQVSIVCIQIFIELSAPKQWAASLLSCLLDVSGVVLVVQVTGAQTSAVIAVALVSGVSCDINSCLRNVPLVGDQTWDKLNQSQNYHHSHKDCHNQGPISVIHFAISWQVVWIFRNLFWLTSSARNQHLHSLSSVILTEMPPVVAGHSAVVWNIDRHI